jgi:hypothetical protein
MIEVSVSVDKVEELFENSYQTRQYKPCTTMILELKLAMDLHITARLLRGEKVSLPEAFHHACDEIIFDSDIEMSDMDW